MVKCLYCGKEQAYMFCAGGGETRALSNTDQGSKFTKSYCYNDFITIHRLGKQMGIESKSDKTYLFCKPMLKVWYKQLPFVEYHTTRKQPKKGVSKNDSNQRRNY